MYENAANHFGENERILNNIEWGGGGRVAGVFTLPQLYSEAAIRVTLPVNYSYRLKITNSTSNTLPGAASGKSHGKCYFIWSCGTKP